MVVLDTSVVIDHLRQPGKTSLLLKLENKFSRQALAISMISLQELYGGESTREEEQERLVLATISPLSILPYNFEISKLAGEIERDLKRPIEFADAAIAATAIYNGASLSTLNKKDFEGIKDLELI